MPSKYTVYAFNTTKMVSIVAGLFYLGKLMLKAVLQSDLKKLYLFFDYHIIFLTVLFFIIKYAVKFLKRFIPNVLKDFDYDQSRDLNAKKSYFERFITFSNDNFMVFTQAISPFFTIFNFFCFIGSVISLVINSEVLETSTGLFFTTKNINILKVGFFLFSFVFFAKERIRFYEYIEKEHYVLMFVVSIISCMSLIYVKSVFQDYPYNVFNSMPSNFLLSITCLALSVISFIFLYIYFLSFDNVKKISEEIDNKLETAAIIMVPILIFIFEYYINNSITFALQFVVGVIFYKLNVLQYIKNFFSRFTRKLKFLILFGSAVLVLTAFNFFGVFAFLSRQTENNLDINFSENKINL